MKEMGKGNDEVTFAIVKKIAVMGINPKTGWTTELNMVSWNGREAKYDLREWSPDHTKMSKGKTFTQYELEKFVEAAKKALSA